MRAIHPDKVHRVAGPIERGVYKGCYCHTVEFQGIQQCSVEATPEDTSPQGTIEQLNRHIAGLFRYALPFFNDVQEAQNYFAEQIEGLIQNEL